MSLSDLFSIPHLLQRIFHYILMKSVENVEEYDQIKQDCQNLRLVCHDFRIILDDQIRRMKHFDFDRTILEVRNTCYHNYDIPSIDYYFQNIIEVFSPSNNDLDILIPIDHCPYCQNLRLALIHDNWHIHLYQGCGGWHCSLNNCQCSHANLLRLENFYQKKS